MATKYEMSKTYQYRKVMKPLLERKRRARINKCLDDLKDLMAECWQQQQNDDPSGKLEKADILELTVQHLRNLKTQKQQKESHQVTAQKSFRCGYIQAANEVSRCLATLPKVDVALGTKLMTHLGLRLNQLESPTEIASPPVSVHTPLSVHCSIGGHFNASSTKQQTTATPLYSPVSSGYASDSDHSRASPAPLTASKADLGLLQMANCPVWRPW